MSVIKPNGPAAAQQAKAVAVAKPQQSARKDVRQEIEVLSPQFKAALPPQISPEKFIRVTMTAINGNPDLLEADRTTLFAAVMRAAQDGLLPDGKEGAIVAYKGRCNWLPMVAGILKKVRNSGDLKSITSQIIYEKDKFRFWTDDAGDHLEHDPQMFEDRGRVIGVYALAVTRDSGTYIEVLNAKQIAEIKATVRSSNGPWNGPFELEMWRKTAIRKLSKRLPMSTDLEDVIRSDDDMYDLDRPSGPDKGKQLAAMIGAIAPEPEPEFDEPGSDG